MISKRLIYVALLAVWVGASSCVHSDAENEVNTLISQVAQIDAYLTENGLVAINDISGVRIVVNQLGTGLIGQKGTTVDVDYVGRLFSDNSVFDSGSQLAKPVTNFINGWIIALGSLPAGSKATVYIPSLYGYGKDGQGPIPSNAILVFDMDFKRIVRTPAELNQLGSDTVSIDNYLASKSIVASKDKSGLRYVLNNTAGPRAGLYDRVSIHVAYKLLTDDTKVVAELDLVPTTDNYGRIVDQSNNGLIVGLTKIPYASKATLYIPSMLGYGTIGAGDGSTLVIPPNSNLIVEVELKDKL